MNVQINDVLFKTNRFVGLEKVKVTKITPTGNIRVNDGSLLTPELRKKTTDSWDNTMYYEWTQELEDRYNLYKLQSETKIELGKLKVFELNKESLEILQQALKKITH